MAPIPTTMFSLELIFGLQVNPGNSTTNQPYRCTTRAEPFANSGHRPSESEHVAAEVRILSDAGELLAHEFRVDHERFAPALLGLEADVLQQLLHYRLETPGTDILERLVDLGCDASERLYAVVGELDRDALGAEQGLILLRQARAGCGQDTYEVLLGQRLEFDTDRQPSLQFGQQVGRLRDVERAAGDEQDVIRLERPVLGRDRCALDQWEQVALD